VVHRIPTVIGVQRRLASEAVRRKARLAILVDSPGTHLGVARRLKQDRVRVGYFIGPQIWAWRPGRVRMVKRLVERMVVIFPFEEPIYREAGVPVDFVGHPLVDVVQPSMTRGEFAARHGLDPARPIIALLPGSRRGEIKRHYPLILGACERLASTPASAAQPQFVLAAAPALGAELFASCDQAGLAVKRVEGGTYDALAAADCAIVASGTATVEAALLGTPMVVVYRVSPTSAFFLRRMVRSPFIAMVNLIAGRRVVSELIQDQFTPLTVEEEVRKILESPAVRDEMKAGLADVRQRLGASGSIERAADIFAEML